MVFYAAVEVFEWNNDMCTLLNVIQGTTIILFAFHVGHITACLIWVVVFYYQEHICSGETHVKLVKYSEQSYVIIIKMKYTQNFDSF